MTRVIMGVENEMRMGRPEAKSLLHFGYSINPGLEKYSTSESEMGEARKNRWMHGHFATKSFSGYLYNLSLVLI